MNSRRLAVAMLCVLALVAIVYWPALHGALVWDDLPCLRDQAWLRGSDAWRGVLAGDFCGWTNYFRPAAVALFVFEVQLFGLDAEPMHALSLALHLANTLLVGLACRSLGATLGARSVRDSILPIAMLCYGLHPTLTEPVAWISAQTELAMTFFMLLGLLLHLQLRPAITRTAVVSICFFFAACAKESAVAFPAALLTVDWVRSARTERLTLRGLLRRTWPSYLGMFIAGVVYLALRWDALGHILTSFGRSELEPFARLQEICYLYATYWRMLLWPMFGLGPVHIVAETRFANPSASALVADAVSLAVVVFTVWSLRKKLAIGGLIAVVSLLLAPALHLLPIAFDESLYHDRYLMAPLAFAAVFLPGAVVEIHLRAVHARLIRVTGAALVVVWLLVATTNVRAILPLWASDTTLWRWAFRMNPEATSAKENLLAGYILQHDPRAGEFADSLIADSHPCPTCLLNVAYFAISEHNIGRADAALVRLQSTTAIATDPRLRQAYDVALGHLLELKHDFGGAEQAFRAAIAAVPGEPAAQFQLALFFARQEKPAESRQAEDAALALFPAEQRTARRGEFDAALSEQARDRAANANPN